MRIDVTVALVRYTNDVAAFKNNVPTLCEMSSIISGKLIRMHTAIIATPRQNRGMLYMPRATITINIETMLRN